MQTQHVIARLLYELQHYPERPFRPFEEQEPVQQDRWNQRAKLLMEGLAMHRILLEEEKN